MMSINAVAPPSPKGATKRSFRAEKCGRTSPLGERGVSESIRKRTNMNSNKIEDMFYGATTQIFANAKMQRSEMTEAENALWEKLRKNQLGGYKFRRQHPISDFIADFYCHDLKLVIEVDGEYHDENEQKQYDEGRTFEMEELGITVIRFQNGEILNDLESVLNRLEAFMNQGEILQ